MRSFLPVFLILLIVLTAGVFVVDKFGLFGLFGGDIMKDITAIAGKDSDFADKYKDSKRVNILVLGSNNSLTDTIMLCSFDTENKRVDVISVPRDTYYERSDYQDPAYQKINSIYGTEGEKALAKAVSKVLCGVPIHFYEILEDKDVASIVDSMGGVEYDIPMDMQYDSKSGDLHIDLKEGKQVLNGEEAVQLLRFRSGYAEGDLGRVNAQQEFMKEAFKQSIGIGFPKVAKTVLDEVDSNLKATMAVRIATKAVGMESKDVETWTTPGYADYMNGASYFFNDPEGTEEMMNEIYSIGKEEK